MDEKRGGNRVNQGIFDRKYAGFWIDRKWQFCHEWFIDVMHQKVIDCIVFFSLNIFTFGFVIKLSKKPAKNLFLVPF